MLQRSILGNARKSDPANQNSFFLDYTYFMIENTYNYNIKHYFYIQVIKYVIQE